MREINQNKRTIKVAKEQSEYRSELSLLKHEVKFFENVLDDLEFLSRGDDEKSKKVKDFVSQSHHFRREITRITAELNQIHHEMTEEVIAENKINAESYKDHQYFRKEMDDLRNNYKGYKYTFRTFVASFEYLSQSIL